MADAERAAKRKRYTSRIITLKVGPQAEAITVHEDRLRDQSAFFKAALEKCWQEGKSGEIALPEDEVDVVSTYVDWLYSKHVVELVEPGKSGSYFQFLAKLYVFGEKCQDDAFCDSALSTLLKQIDKKDGDGNRWFPGDPSIRITYEGTTAGSPARRCLVDMCAVDGNKSWPLFSANSKVPVDFLLDLSREMFQWREKSTPPVKGKSWYDRRKEYFKQK